MRRSEPGMDNLNLGREVNQLVEEIRFQTVNQLYQEKTLSI